MDEAELIERADLQSRRAPGVTREMIDPTKLAPCCSQRIAGA